jgi:drug/metabolite transporter (DMT)-like permease
VLLLLIVSFIWAFSFGLIKGRLAGIDPTAVGVIRLALALVVFLPFFRPRAVPIRVQLRLALIGAIEFGVMYLLYLRAFKYLQAFEVALFTITTPIFVSLLGAGLARRFVPRHLVAALLSVIGAGVIVWQNLATRNMLVGIALIQASNLCFAIGQLAWRQTRATIDSSKSDAALFALPYAGALAAALLWSLFTTDWIALRLTGPQIATLAYLGVLASGVGFFWWNVGATRVNTGTLAAFNNGKIPLAVACSLLFFGEHADVSRLLVGGVVVALGVILAERRK